MWIIKDEEGELYTDEYGHVPMFDTEEEAKDYPVEEFGDFKVEKFNDA